MKKILLAVLVMLMAVSMAAAEEWIEVYHNKKADGAEKQTFVDADSIKKNASTYWSPGTLNIAPGQTVRAQLMSSVIPRGEGYSYVLDKGSLEGVVDGMTGLTFGTVVAYIENEGNGVVRVTGANRGSGVLRATLYDPSGNFTGEQADLHIVVGYSSSPSVSSGGGGGCNTVPGVFFAVVLLMFSHGNKKRAAK